MSRSLVGCSMTLLTAFFVLLIGCGESKPTYPRTYYDSLEDVVIQPVRFSWVKLTSGPIFAKDSGVAVFSFQSPEDNQGGALVSDVFAAALQREGIKVVERDNIEKILLEQDLAEGGRAALSDLEVASRLGSLSAADYMVFGAVTLYKSEPQTVYLPVRIKTEDRDSYTAEYNTYRTWYVDKFWPFWKDSEQREKELRTEEGVYSLGELEEEMKKAHVRQTSTIASIGISAKVVDVRNARIVWMGQAETNDFTLVGGADRLVATFLASIQERQAVAAASPEQP